MKFLVFKYTEDDWGNDRLMQIEVDEYLTSEEEILEWLPTLGCYSGTRYLIVAAASWTTAIIKDKPVIRVAKAVGWDDETLRNVGVKDD